MLFKRKKTKTPERNISGVIDALAVKTGKRLQKIQTSWAGWMGRKAEALSPRGRKFALFIFLLVGTIYCTVMMLRGPLIRWQAKSISIPFTPIPLGKGMEDALENYQNSYRQSKDLDIITMDLRSNPIGRRYLDSLLKTRPGLTDSLDTMISIYKKQMILKRNNNQ